MKTQTAFAILALIAASAATGCGSSSSSTPTTGAQRASLHRAKSCPDLLADLKADASYKINRAISRQIESIQSCIQRNGDAQCAYYGGYVGVDYAGAAESGAARNAAPAADASASGASSSSSSGGSDSAQSYSQTNTQVKGVDEADIVKNDGKNIYVLHGNTFKVINAWPANELKEVGSIDVEGQPQEMFVSDGKVVVYSQVNGDKIFSAAGVTPKTQYTDYGYPMPARAAVASDVAYYPGYTSTYAPLTKVTVMTLNGTAPAVAREVYFEGNYLDARRVDAHVRTVLQGYAYGPKLKYSIYEMYAADANGATTADQTPKTGSETIRALERLRSQNLASISNSQLGEWLPYTFIKDASGVHTKTVACEDFYVPSVGSTENGMTEVVSIDLANPIAEPRESAILGRTETVYGNANTMYLAAQAYVEPPFSWYDEGVVGSGGGVAVSPPSTGGVAEPAPAPSPTPGGKAAAIAANVRTQADPVTTAPTVAYSTANTHIHKFDFANQADFPNYIASGTVAGTLKDQFSLDDRDGFLRVATTETRNYVTTEGKWVSADTTAPTPGQPAPARPSTINHVYVLGVDGPWLETKGDVGELAPNERIFSVRFLGGRGYVVTFRQVDPLFVVDLAAPSNPRLLAALKIPGFSEYMHPLDENHLLTIGRNASTSGRTQGLQLQIFDVTDGASPKLQHQFTYTGQEYGQSEAEYDHKAFTFFAEKGLLAFPYYSYNGWSNANDTGVRSTLELFKVDVNTGFAKLGSIDGSSLVSSAPTGYCGGYFAPSVRRGVFLENFAYAVSYGGIVAKDSNNLGAAGSQLALPPPKTNESYGPVCAY